MVDLTLEEIKEKHDKAYQNGQDTRIKSANDLSFYYVTQWSDETLSETNLNYRGQFDVLRKAGRKILAEMYENEIHIDFEPVEDINDNASEVLDGLYRRDTNNNTHTEAEQAAVNEAVICGMGAYEITTEYKVVRKGRREQYITFKPIYEANSTVFFDPNAKKIDKSDATYCSVLGSYTPEGYKELYEELTGKEATDINMPNFRTPENSNSFIWVSQYEKIYVTRFYHIVEKTQKMFVLEDMFGMTTEISEEDLNKFSDDYIAEGFNIVEDYELTYKEVHLYICSGNEILHHQIISGHNIPIIPIYGEYSFVQGQPHYEGVTRLAKDPQMLRNFAMSYLADIVSQSPREKPILSPQQIEGYEDMYEQNGPDNNYPYVFMNDHDDNGDPIPKTVGTLPAPSVPANLLPLLTLTRESIEDVANDGIPQDYHSQSLINNTSGAAIVEMSKRIDMQSVVYQKHRQFMKNREAEVYASIASVIYDTPRKERTVSNDGSSHYVDLMKTAVDEKGNTIITNDLRNKSFIITTKYGKSYKSKLSETINNLKEMIAELPQGSPERNILQLKLLQITPGEQLEDVRKYARNQLLLLGIQKPETDEEIAMVEANASKEDPLDPAVILAQAEMLKGQADMIEQRIEQDKLALEAKYKEADLNIDAYDSITKRMDTQVKAAKAQVDVIDSAVEQRNLQTAAPIE